MNCQSHLFSGRGVPLSRRWFLRECGIGLGKIGLAALLTEAFSRQAAAASKPLQNPLAPRSPHFPGKAKAVIHLFMAGAPSQLDQIGRAHV